MNRLFRTDAVTTEQLISPVKCIVWLIVPENTTVGTITLRDSTAADGNGPVKHLAAIGLGQSGKLLGGVLFEKGLTVQMSSASDRAAITWEAVP